MKLFNRIKKAFNRIDDTPDDFDWEQVDAWNEVIYDRDDLKINDKKSRHEYVIGCLEQIAEASKEVEALQYEYNEVTSRLKDMEEVENLPPEELDLVKNCARRILELKKEQADYLERKVHMNEAKYRAMERIEDELADACKKLKDTEDYQVLIKRDLKKLENEKQAYYFRKDELKKTIDDCKSMAVVCMVAVVVCVLILLIMQYGFSLNTSIGYLACALAGAIGITMIFIKNSDSRSELRSVENGIGTLIRLQNTVKIRYVNNTNLLDYLYVKYNVTSAKEFLNDYSQYEEEKKERIAFERAEEAMTRVERDMLHTLRRYEVKDPTLWLHQCEAILDKKEMVEIRHKLIIQRQSLRRRIDYNKEIVAANAQNEIKDLVDRYPRYAAEILEIVDDYEHKFS